MKREPLGNRIILDANVCHGSPTFRGTRIFVADVLEQVARGLTPRQIVQQWDGKVTEGAIAAAVLMARSALLGGTPPAPKRRLAR